MKPVSWPLVGVVALGLSLAGFALSWTMVALGRSPLVLTPWLGLLFGLIAVGLLWAGIGVKRLKSGKRTRITPVQAARVAAFARSALMNGAGFAGFFAGVGIVAMFRLWAPAMSAAAVGAGVACLGAIVMTVVSVIVERWCVDDSSGERKAGAG